MLFVKIYFLKEIFNAYSQARKLFLAGISKNLSFLSDEITCMCQKKKNTKGLENEIEFGFGVKIYACDGQWWPNMIDLSTLTM